MFCLVIAWSDR